MLLTQTTTPEDVKALNRAELPQLCGEIRHAILESSAAVGGHVAPNLASLSSRLRFIACLTPHRQDCL